MPRKRPLTYLERALAYAHGVADGEILACRYVRQACERWLRDCNDPALLIDERAIEVRCGFAESFPHVKGKWARDRETLKLSEWQVWIYAAIWGTKVAATGLRKYRKVYLEVPRKNGKSIIGAETGNYMLTEEGEFGAEVYCGATTEKQAWEVFRPARSMALWTPDFREHYGVDVHAKSLSVLSDGSRFEPIIGNPGDGSSPSCAIIDEYHEHRTDAIYATMLTGMGAREQPLIMVITTAGEDISGPCYDLRNEAIQILDGIFDDAASEQVFAVIYTVDPEDDWQSEEALQKANPNLGISVSREALIVEQQTACRKASAQGPFKTKHLNVWVQQMENFLNIQKWLGAGDPSLRIEDFAGKRCAIGVDLSSRIDFTALTVVFDTSDDPGRHEYVWFPFLFLPQSQIDDGPPIYRQWHGEGFIEATPGEEIDFVRVREVMVELNEMLLPVEVPFDPWRAAGIEQELTAQGVPMTRFPQVPSRFADPMNEVEAALESGRIRHDGNPALSWMASNLTTRRDGKGNNTPNKSRAEKKIDGMVAGTMAVGRLLAHRERRSYLADGGMTVL